LLPYGCQFLLWSDSENIVLGALGGFHLHFLYRLAIIYATFAYVTALALFISTVAGAFFIKSPTFLYSLFKLSLDLFVFFFNTSTPSSAFSLLVVHRIKCRWCFFSPFLCYISL